VSLIPVCLELETKEYINENCEARNIYGQNAVLDVIPIYNQLYLLLVIAKLELYEST